MIFQKKSSGGLILSLENEEMTRAKSKQLSKNYDANSCHVARSRLIITGYPAYQRSSNYLNQLRPIPIERKIKRA